jgi:basic amino acid/polyamine antiporter, APA family
MEHQAVGAETTLYTRKATGLVREIGVGTSVGMNLAFMSFPYGLLLVTLGPFSFSGANIALVALVAAILVLLPITLYGSLGQAMPRTGGDYVFVSRIISPPVGFAANFNIEMWFIIATAGLAASLAPFGLGSAFGALGVATNSSSMTNAAADVSSKAWQFWLGAAALAATMIIISLSLRLWIRIFNILFGLVILGVLVAIFLLATHSRHSFETSLAHFGVSYQGILNAATHAGYSGGGGFSLKNTILATPLAASSFIFAIASVYYGSEIRQARRSMLRGLLYALGAFFILYVACLLLAERVVGQSFLGAATFLANVDPKHYPFAASPSFYFFTALNTKSAVLIGIMQLGFVLALYVGFMVTCMVMARNLFAWSFDRIIPDRISSVSKRTSSPLVANVIIFIAMLVFLALIVYGPATFEQIILTAVAGQILTMLYVAVSGIVLPWRKPDLYELTPLANKKILGLPTISVVGVLSVGVYLLFLIPLLTNSALGANNRDGLIAVAVIFLVGYPIYFVSRWVNRRRGIDLSLAFRELPPE